MNEVAGTRPGKGKTPLFRECKKGQTSPGIIPLLPRFRKGEEKEKTTPQKRWPIYLPPPNTSKPTKHRPVSFNKRSQNRKFHIGSRVWRMNEVRVHAKNSLRKGKMWGGKESRQLAGGEESTPSKTAWGKGNSGSA